MLADCGVWYKMTKSRDTTNNRTGFLVVIKEGRYGFDQQKGEITCHAVPNINFPIYSTEVNLQV